MPASFEEARQHLVLALLKSRDVPVVSLLSTTTERPAAATRRRPPLPPPPDPITQTSASRRVPRALEQLRDHRALAAQQGPA